MGKRAFILICLLLTLTGCAAADMQPIFVKEETDMQKYKFPAEDKKHEGTWLTWPHHYTYGVSYREEIEPVWIEMVKALNGGENVHIIAYDKTEKKRITKILESEAVDMTNVDFLLARSDDVWTRDTGPIFVYDESKNIVIANFAFDGWGEKTAFERDNKIPAVAAETKNIPIINISGLVLEGGSVELDGAGTLMACKSSVVSSSRNWDMTAAQVEKYLTKYLGATNFIWLEGVEGEDITDAHIDGMARFYDENTLITVSKSDFLDMYETIRESDYEVLLNGKNTKGQPYKIVELPMTVNNVDGLDYRGSYLNYYVGNDVILLPVYNDTNDKKAMDIIQKLYRSKKVVPIDVSALFQYGGMLHCVTQQQPSR